VNVLWLDQTRRAGEEAFLLAFDSDCLDAIALMEEAETRRAQVQRPQE
jgi:hypothetical protein